MINLEIIEEDSYEKDALFYVELGEPLLQGGEYRVFHNSTIFRDKFQFSAFVQF